VSEKSRQTTATPAQTPDRQTDRQTDILVRVGGHGQNIPISETQCRIQDFEERAWRIRGNGKKPHHGPGAEPLKVDWDRPPESRDLEHERPELNSFVCSTADVSSDILRVKI